MTQIASAPTSEGPAGVSSNTWFDPRCVWAVARKEVRDSLRNKWFLLYTVAFVALALGLSMLSMVGTGFDGFAGFGRTAAGLVNLVTLIVPLMALTAGASCIASERERGSLAYLLAHPVTRLEVLLGKYMGLAAAIGTTIALGFGSSAAVIGAQGGGGAEAGAFLRLTALAFLLALGMLSVGMLISVFARRSSVALGAAVFVWLVFVFFGDLGLIGSTVIFKLQVTELFRLSLLNPLQVFKMASLDGINASLDVLGPAGMYAQATFGDRLTWIFGGGLAAWICIPLGLAFAVFLRRGVT